MLIEAPALVDENKAADKHDFRLHALCRRIPVVFPSPLIGYDNAAGHRG
jgi:hypothetical protein